MSLADKFTIGLAIYGAVLASALALWEIYKYGQDRPRLRVKAWIAEFRIRFVVHGESVERKDEFLETGNPPFLAVEIANVHRLPVVVARVGGIQGGVDFSIKYPPVELPQTLEPDAVMQVAGPSSLADESLESLGVWDLTGRRWLLGRRQIRALKKQARKIAAAGAGAR
jgi:hypothetical protein